MPTICSRLSLPNSVSSGASSWQGTHHDAQTLTTLTLPLKTAGSRPGTCAPSRARPSSCGSAVCGAGRPIKAEGILEGSPLYSRSKKIPASAMKPTSGSATSHDRRFGATASLMARPPRRARGLELAQARFLAAIIDRDPDNEGQHHGRDQHIGHDDEGRVGTERG